MACKERREDGKITEVRGGRGEWRGREVQRGEERSGEGRQEEKRKVEGRKGEEEESE